SVIFHVERHPKYTWYTQCVTFNFFPTPKHELAYNLFNVITVYALPLVIITTSYSLILYSISKNARQAKRLRRWRSTQKFSGDFLYLLFLMLECLPLLSGEKQENGGKTAWRLDNINTDVIHIRYTKYTLYFFYFSRASAMEIDPKVQRGLFIFAVSNACIDPIVYGMFTTAFRREARKWRGWFKRQLSKMGLYTVTSNTAIEQDFY
ncbi:hypothetical protein KUTeg_017588, partial [Tegillarca granosa]